ncbi:hypothetical protein D3C76_1651720 [compost metagenome]
MKTDDTVPAFLSKDAAGLCRIIIKLAKTFRLRTVQHRDLAPDINRRTAIKLLYPRML